MDEFDIIRRYFFSALMPDYVSIGPGDDCAVLSVPADSELCVSTDTLLSGVHFPVDAAPEVVVDRAFAANLSDLAAMGAAPHAVTMALTFPEADAAWLEAFSSATRRWSETIPLVGGNLTKGALSITLTVMGVTPTGKALLRSGASPGDDVYVSGNLGGAAGAVQELGQAAPDAALRKKYEHPVPRLALGAALRGIASAAIDISDGLVSDLGHLLRSSHAGAELALDQLPIFEPLVAKFGRERSETFALCGGDDYELCFTASPAQRETISKLESDLNLPLVRIGSIVPGEPVIRDTRGKTIDGAGYKHF